MEKKSYLYRLRILFDEAGRPTLVETVHKTVIVDGDQRHAAGESVEAFDLELVDGSLIEALVAGLNRIAAE